MITVRHLKKQIRGKYRCIVISDIHSHLDRFKQLLEKINYTSDDYLVILGDFVEKGTQTIETIEFLQKLQNQSERVYVILGNCEYALEQLVCNNQYASEMYKYLCRIGKSGMITQAISRLSIDRKMVSLESMQLQVRNYLQPYFEYLKTLPTTLQLNNFIFVHAGIENRCDWQNSSLSSMIEMKDFYRRGHCLSEYVIVGHLPTSNQHVYAINNDIIINNDKRIISIDGGTGVKSISQLNALIIHGDNEKYFFEKQFVQPLPCYQSIIDINCEEKITHKIAWPNYEVNLLEKGKFFSTCLQVNTNNILKIKNEFLYYNDEKLYCLDDYIDHRISLNKGDIVKMIGIYGIYAYVIKDGKVGWVKYRYLKKCE